DQVGAAFGQRFHQHEVGLGDVVGQPQAHRLVVQRVGQAVAAGGDAVVEAHADVQQQRLGGVALAVVHADQGVKAQAFDENDVGHPHRITAAAQADAASGGAPLPA